VELPGDFQTLSPQRGPGVKDEAAVVKSLGTEAGLSQEDALLYLNLLRLGQIPASEAASASNLLDRGMVIVSGDGKRIIPVHPRLGIANYYRIWRENMVREINERRMRIDKLILELIPVYEAAMEKKTMGGGG
jgi:sugar-specific transcriptional regulator TrmB